LAVGFIGHFITQLAMTLNFSAIPNLHALQITTAHAKSFPICCVFTSCSLVTASNNRDCSASAPKSSLCGGSLPSDSFVHKLPYRTDLVAPVVSFITSRRQSNRKRRPQYCFLDVVTHTYQCYLSACIRYSNKSERKVTRTS
jgi:hypothetical protein